MNDDISLWVFGYGSLMWDPGFEFVERQVSRLHGWHRSFCMKSIHYRGTPEDPGLVLALDAAAGAVCDGVAFGVARRAEQATLAYLHERELISDAYLEERLPIRLSDGRDLTAVTYVIDHAHPQYCAGLDLESQARIIARCRGQNGSNADYLWNTTAHLGVLGLSDPDLDWLSDRVRALKAAA
ncbi:MAG TPA: gamma-glutamylcyclotransferase [Paracoccaceae bacterium]|nr:gamma-glutamylcyclotransferase [Paracoccaceae bacterium]